jgi:hypothetical protein
MVPACRGLTASSRRQWHHDGDGIVTVRDRCRHAEGGLTMKPLLRRRWQRHCTDGIVGVASMALALPAPHRRRWHRSIDDGAIEGEGRLVEEEDGHHHE